MKYIRILTLTLLAMAIGGTVSAGRQDVSVAKHATMTNPGQSEMRSLIQFDVSSFQGKRIDYAVIELEFEPPADSAEHYVVTLFPVSRSWNSNAAWSTGWTNAGGDFVPTTGVAVSVAKKRGYKARVHLTELVKEWVAGNLTNNGLIIVSDQKAADKAKLKTDLFTNPGSAPKLRVHSTNR